MTIGISQIQEDLERVKNLIHQKVLLSFSSEDKASLMERIAELGQKLSAVEASFLTIGLLGGTGVGKSTIMNALAGAEISSTSHRRPHTDHVLIYMHEKAGPLPALELENLPWKAFTHSEDKIKPILLCDLPDFDSLMGKNRETVLHFLEHLDVLVWITSPEKYGDSRFYEVLQRVPKAKQNFIFVLNKADLLFQGKEPERGYSDLNQAAQNFQAYIREQGLNEPLLYVLSSQEAAAEGALSPWNQFPAFRRHLFLQRDMKQVMAIKAANLEIEARNLLSFLGRETRDLERFIAVLQEAERDFVNQKEAWVHAGEDAMDSWLHHRVKPGIMRHRSDPSRLVGPGYGIALLFQAFHGSTEGGTEEPPDLSRFKPPEALTFAYRKRFQWAEEHLGHIIHRENLGAAYEENARTTINAGARFDALGERFLSAVLAFTARPAPAFRWFKAYQGLAYAVLLALFLFALGGERAWLDFIANPGPSKALQVLITMIHAAFSTKGLAALGSYALLSLLLGFRFYRRYRRLLLRAGESTLAALRITLGALWEEALSELVSDVAGLKREMVSRLETLSSLRKS